MTVGSELIVDQINLTGGLIIKMMTNAERDAYFNSPDPSGQGALIYNTDAQQMQFFDGIEWTPTKSGYTVQF